MILTCNDFIDAGLWSVHNCCQACHAGDLCETKVTNKTTVEHCCSFSPRYWTTDPNKLCAKVIERKIK